MSVTSTSSNLIHTHSRTLTYYKSALTTANARIQTLESTLSSLQSQFNALRTSHDRTQQRCAELDRDARVRLLELKSALRARRTADSEAAALRLQLQELRAAQPPPPLPQQSHTFNNSDNDERFTTAPESPTDAEHPPNNPAREAAAEALAKVIMQDHTGHLEHGCDCEAAKAVRSLYRPGGFMLREPERPRRTELRLRLRQAGERVGRRSRAEILQGIVGEYEQGYLGTDGGDFTAEGWENRVKAEREDVDRVRRGVSQLDLRSESVQPQEDEMERVRKGISRMGFVR